MSYKRLQLSPQASTRGTNMRIAIQGPWSAPLGSSPDMQFLKSWLEYDSELEDVAGRRVNRRPALGLALSFGLSATFWAAIVLIVARVW